jgi:hypothetical protein
MSATERQRRWRAKLRASKPVLKTVVSAAPVERLRARIRELEAEIEKLHSEVTRFMRAWAGSWTVTKARVRELEAELANERARREALVDVADLPMTYRKKYKVARRGLERALEDRANDRARQEAYSILDEIFLPSFAREDAHRSHNNMLDGRKPFVPVKTGYRRHAIWLLDPASNELVGPLVRMAGRTKTQAKNSTRGKRAAAPGAAHKRVRTAGH